MLSHYMKEANDAISYVAINHLSLQKHNRQLEIFRFGVGTMLSYLFLYCVALIVESSGGREINNSIIFSFSNKSLWLSFMIY